jgi:hypothetical protein
MQSNHAYSGIALNHERPENENIENSGCCDRTCDRSAVGNKHKLGSYTQLCLQLVLRL